jgi:hypothetical protein
VNIFSPFQYASNSAAYNLFSNVAQLIAITYHASFFFLNLFFNKIFRKEIFTILGIIIRRKNSSFILDASRTNNNITENH